MRILVFSPWAHGTSYYTAGYCNALASRGVSVLLLIPENFMVHLLSENVKRMPWPYVAPPKMNLASVLECPFQAMRLLRTVQRTHPDWVHLLWLHPVPCLLAPWLRRFRVAFTAHDPVLHTGEGGVVRRWVQTQHVGLARICFVRGEENRRKLVDEYGLNPESVHITLLGEFTPWDEIPLVQQDRMILFFGRVRKYKGLDVLLDAFEKVSPLIPGYRLRICGEGELGDLGRRALSMANVEVINRFIDHAEVPLHFRSSRFLVLPYLDGTQSGVVPMAFSLGRTCVVSAVGSIPEVVHHGMNGLLVRPGNSDELADAMLRLVQDEELRRRLERGALESARNSDSLSWELAARTAVTAYGSSLDERCEGGTAWT
jgi:glycosyltransferase involved in cell wall biosynthesis